jgi:hypothetical protein
LFKKPGCGQGALIRGKLQQQARSVVRGDDGLRGRPVRLVVANGFVVGFSVRMGARDTSGKAKLGLGKGGPGPEEVSSAAASVDWQPMAVSIGASVVMSLIAAIVLSRKTGTQGFITVEDFFGGFVIGAPIGYGGSQYFEKAVVPERTPR